VRDVLVRSHDCQAPAVSIDAPHFEDVVAVLKVGAEHFFIVTKPVTALRGHQESGHGLDRELAMALLENGAYIDLGVDICPCRRVFRDRRLGGGGEKLA
jgi:hypothetical protein